MSELLVLTLHSMFTTEKDFKIKMVHLTQIDMLVSVLFKKKDLSSTEFIT
jgi:hypothetical protein